jgi:hypothetical protein
VNGDDIALRDWTKRELATVIVDRIEAALAPDGPGR